MNYNNNNQGHKFMQNKPKSIFDISDITNLINSYCSEDSLLKLSQLNKNIRKVTVEDNKDRLIKVLKYKYKKVCQILEQIIEQIHNGQLIDRKYFQKCGYTGYNQTDDYIEQQRNHLSLQKIAKNFMYVQNFNDTISKLFLTKYFFLNSKVHKIIEQQILNEYKNQNKIYSNQQFNNYIINNYNNYNDISYEEQFYELMLERRNKMKSQYEQNILNQINLDNDYIQFMQKIQKKDTSVKEILDGYLNFKVNQKKLQAQQMINYLKGDNYNLDLDYPQMNIKPELVIQSVSNKLINKQMQILEPLKQTQSIKDLKTIFYKKFACRQEDEYNYLDYQKEYKIQQLINQNNNSQRSYEEGYFNYKKYSYNDFEFKSNFIFKK